MHLKSSVKVAKQSFVRTKSLTTDAEQFQITFLLVKRPPNLNGVQDVIKWCAKCYKNIGSSLHNVNT